MLLEKEYVAILGSSSVLMNLPMAIELEKSGISCVQLSLDHSNADFHDKVQQRFF